MSSDRRLLTIDFGTNVPSPIAEHVLAAYGPSDAGKFEGWQRTYSWFTVPRRALGTFLIARVVYIIVAWYAFAIGRANVVEGTYIGAFIVAHGLLVGYLLLTVAELGLLEWLSLMVALSISPLEAEIEIADRFGLARGVVFGGQSLYYGIASVLALLVLVFGTGTVTFW